MDPMGNRSPKWLDLPFWFFFCNISIYKYIHRYKNTHIYIYKSCVYIYMCVCELLRRKQKLLVCATYIDTGYVFNFRSQSPKSLVVVVHPIFWGKKVRAYQFEKGFYNHAREPDCGWKYCLVGGFNPFSKIFVKLDHFPKQGWKFSQNETTTQLWFSDDSGQFENKNQLLCLDLL